MTKQREFEREAAKYEQFAASQWAVGAIECVSYQEAPELPISIRRTLKNSVRSYNYILMPKLSNGTLLAFLMRAIHNNGLGYWRKISMRLQ